MMVYRTPKRKALDCIATLFNGFGSKEIPWGAMQEVYEGRQQLEGIVQAYFNDIDVPEWIPAPKERIEYKNMDGEGWKEGIIYKVVVREGRFVALVQFDNTGRFADYSLTYVRKLNVTVYE